MGNQASLALAARDAVIKGDIEALQRVQHDDGVKDARALLNHIFKPGQETSHGASSSTAPLATPSKIGTKTTGNHEIDETCGWTLCHFAARHARSKVLKFLLDAGANYGVRDEHHARTPLFVAVEQGAHECVKLLLHATTASTPINLNNILAVRGPHSHGWSIWHAACASGSVETLRVLVEYASSTESAIDLSLGYEFRFQHTWVNAFGELVAENTNIENRQPLLVAVQYGHVEIVQELLTTHADLVDIHAATSDGVTALAWAAADGRARICQLLLEHETDIDRRRQALHTLCPSALAMTPLHWAALHGHAHTCHILLTYAPRLLTLHDLRGRLPLHLAAERGYTEVCRELLSPEHTEGNGADGDDTDSSSCVNAVTLEGETALHLAARNGHAICVELFLTHGARTDVRDAAFAARPLDLAADRQLRDTLWYAGTKSATSGVSVWLKKNANKAKGGDGPHVAQVKYGNIDLGAGMFYRGYSLYKMYSPQRLPHGQGSMYVNSVLNYTGEFREGLRRGRGMQVLENIHEQISLTSQWREDLPMYDEPMRIQYRFGQVYNGHIMPKHGDMTAIANTEDLSHCLSREGVGSMTYGSNNILYYGRWADDSRNGFGIEVNRDQMTTLYCHFDNGVPNGAGVKFFPNGSVFVGSWSCENDGQMTGPGMLYQEDGTVVCGEWKRDDCVVKATHSTCTVSHVQHAHKHHHGHSHGQGTGKSSKKSGGDGGKSGSSHTHNKHDRHDQHNVKPIEKFTDTGLAPGDKWAGLFDGLAIVPYKPPKMSVDDDDGDGSQGVPHPGDIPLDASDLPALYSHIWRAMCKGGPFQNVTSFLQGWFLFRYVEHRTRHDLVLALDDLKSFAQTLSRFATVYLSNTWSQHIVTEAIVEVLVDLLYAPVLKVLYDLEYQWQHLDYTARARVLAHAHPAQFGLPSSVLPHGIANTDDPDTKAYRAFVDHVQAAMGNVRYQPEYISNPAPAQSPAVGLGQWVVTDAMHLRQMCEDFARAGLDTLGDGVTIAFPRTLAMLAALSVPAVPRFKLALVFMLHEVLDEEIQEYAAQNGEIATGQNDAIRDNAFLYVLSHCSDRVNLLAQCRFLLDFPTEDTAERETRATLSSRVSHFRVLSVRGELVHSAPARVGVSFHNRAGCRAAPLSPAAALGRNPIEVLRNLALEIPLGGVARTPYLQSLSTLLRFAAVLSQYAVPGIKFPVPSRFHGLFIDPVLLATMSILGCLGIVPQVAGQQDSPVAPGTPATPSRDNNDDGDDDKDNDDSDDKQDKEKEKEGEGGSHTPPGSPSAATKQRVTVDFPPPLMWECVLDAGMYTDALTCINELYFIGTVLQDSDASSSRRYPFQ